MIYASVCSGIESASIAFSQIEGWEPCWFSQYDPEHNYNTGPDFPSRVLAHHFPSVPNLGDMNKIEHNEVFKNSHFDLLVGGTPCFTADTLIITTSGPVPISEIKKGDVVLTHTGSWRKVLKTGNKMAKTVTLKGHGSHGIRTTEDHPFYCYKKTNKWNNDRRAYEQHLSTTPEWIKAKDAVGSFWCIPHNAEELPTPEIELKGRENIKTAITPEFMWLCGHYVGNGWLRFKKTKAYILTCCNKRHTKRISELIRKTGLNVTITNERTTTRFQIASYAISRWLYDQFGTGAGNKRIPSWLLSTKDTELKNKFIQGYLDADGCVSKNNKRTANGYTATTISKPLSVCLKILMADKFSVSETYTIPSKTKILEGRIVNQRPLYQLRFHDKSRTARWSSLHLIQKIKSITPTNEKEKVYNLEVEGDNSYTADGIVVHNCQSFSLAGLRGGMDDSRGNLSLEFCRILAIKKPRWFVWENVPGVHSSFSDEKSDQESSNNRRGAKGVDAKKRIGGARLGGRDYGADALVQSSDFARLLEAFQECGYSVCWRILDSQFFGVPQRRRRVFACGSFGTDWAPPFAVLFEPESLRGDSSKGKKKRKATAGKTSTGPTSGGEWWDGGQTAQTLDAVLKKGQTMPEKNRFPAVLQNETFGIDDQTNALADKAPPLRSQPNNEHSVAYINPDPNVQSFDSRNDALNNNISGTLQSKKGVSLNYINPIIYNVVQITSKINGSNPSPGDPAPTLPSGGQPHIVIADPISFDWQQLTQPTNRNEYGANKPASAVVKSGRQCVSGEVKQVQWASGGGQVENDTAQALRARAETNYQFVRYVINDQGGDNISVEKDNVSPTLRSQSHQHEPVVVSTLTKHNLDSRSPQSEEQQRIVSAVFNQTQIIRRLTPLECERLQGLPDFWTLIPIKKVSKNQLKKLKPGLYGLKDGELWHLSTDSDRYESIGNCMTTNVMHYIANRIDKVDKILKKLGRY